jgi:hypothetical protein
VIGKGYMYTLHTFNCYLRPYRHEHTASRPIREVKHGRGQRVLPWVTRREHCAAAGFFFCPAGGGHRTLCYMLTGVATHSFCTQHVHQRVAGYREACYLTSPFRPPGLDQGGTFCRLTASGWWAISESATRREKCPSHEQHQSRTGSIQVERLGHETGFANLMKAKASEERRRMKYDDVC